jgi:hypothetical protein
MTVAAASGVRDCLGGWDRLLGYVELGLVGSCWARQQRWAEMANGPLWCLIVLLCSFPFPFLFPAAQYLIFFWIYTKRLGAPRNA